MLLSQSERATCYGGQDAEWNNAIRDACPSLQVGCVPPPWAGNPHIQNVLTLVRDRSAPPMLWDSDEFIPLDDGGHVSIQWSGLAESAGTPVIVLMHTICGSSDALRRLVADLRASLGWVVAGVNRRGHTGRPLGAAQINTMGSTADLRRQIERIRVRRPGAPLYGVGISAGSGLLVRYLGEEGEASAFDAAVAVCPAYDVPAAFGNVDPRYDRYLTRRLLGFFLGANRSVLGRVPGFERCMASRTILEFHERLYPLAGYESFEAYIDGSNPMRVATNVTTPTLVINAADDPVCVQKNLDQHLDAMQALPRMILTLTRHGSHCGFFEGPGARSSWLTTAISEFLPSAAVRA
ncbi:MAG: putative alpha/beta-fold hydrolase [Hyphomicrobiaceae bacterium]|jgi:predicted alpha/beta-fold hydrolase